MRDFAHRMLTEGEISLGRGVFGDAVAWPRVGIAQAPRWVPFAAAAPFGRTIIYGQWRAAEDFAHAPRDQQGWFVHELAHVWQAARGVVLAFAKLRALGKSAYRVTLTPDVLLRDLNIEAQAEVARFLFLARLGERTPYPRAVLEDVWARA